MDHVLEYKKNQFLDHVKKGSDLRCWKKYLGHTTADHYPEDCDETLGHTMDSDPWYDETLGYTLDSNPVYHKVLDCTEYSPSTLDVNNVSVSKSSDIFDSWENKEEEGHSLTRRDTNSVKLSDDWEDLYDIDRSPSASSSSSSGTPKVNVLHIIPFANDKRSTNRLVTSSNWNEQQIIYKRLSNMNFKKKRSLSHYIDVVLGETKLLSEKFKIIQTNLEKLFPRLPNQVCILILSFWSVNLTDHELKNTVTWFFDKFNFKFFDLKDVYLKHHRICM
jgi:hypothetical protein